jgi:ribbon-helix-helix CopG family protein
VRPFKSKTTEQLAHVPQLSNTDGMKSLTIRLPDSLAKRIEQDSLTRGLSKSDIVRERLDGPGMPSVRESGLREILERAWATKAPTRRSQFRSPKKQKLAEPIRAKRLHWLQSRHSPIPIHPDAQISI